MSDRHIHLAKGLAAGLLLAAPASAHAETLITDFHDFNLDRLFAWADATIDSGSTNYVVTYTGFGSGYKGLDPAIDASGETTVELTVTISASGVAPNAPASGPIVALVDGDGTMATYAWYGQTLGHHVLTAAISSGTGLSSGGTSGLDLSTLSGFHLEDDPGSYKGEYTISFEKLRLTGAPLPKILSKSFDVDSQQFSVTWKSVANRHYTILYTSDLAAGFAPLVIDIPSGGNSTTTSVALPDGGAGFVRILQQ